MAKVGTPRFRGPVHRSQAQKWESRLGTQSLRQVGWDTHCAEGQTAPEVTPQTTLAEGAQEQGLATLAVLRQDPASVSAPAC